MTKSLNKLSLVAVAILCAMPSGYRRAGFSLEQGKNSLDVNQEQFKTLDADKNLTVTVVTDNANAFADDTFNNSDLYDQINCLKNKVIELTDLCTTQQQDILESEKQLKRALAASRESSVNVGEIGNTGEVDGLNVSSAPQALHHWIAVIDDLNEKAPLTKKPNCDHLTITVDDEPLTPTAAERDDAWAWYQANVITTDINTREKGE
jgi:hypothetical protein